MSDPARTNEPVHRFDRSHAIWAKLWVNFNNGKATLTRESLNLYEERFARLNALFWKIPKAIF